VLRLFELLPFGNGIIGRHASNLLIIRISCELANEHRKAKVDVDYFRLTLDSLFFTFKKKHLTLFFFTISLSTVILGTMFISKKKSRGNDPFDL